MQATDVDAADVIVAEALGVLSLFLKFGLQPESEVSTFDLCMFRYLRVGDQLSALANIQGIIKDTLFQDETPRDTRRTFR